MTEHTQAQASEREAFEAWARDHLGQGYSLETDEGAYLHNVTRWAFKAWQASAALAGDAEIERRAELQPSPNLRAALEWFVTPETTEQADYRAMLEATSPAPAQAPSSERCLDCGDVVPKSSCYCQEHCVHASREPSSEVKASDARLAANTDLLTYVLQDDVHNRLTPRVIDIAYMAFHLGKQPNKEDGGSSDWFNDTRPAVREAIDKLRKDLLAAKSEPRAAVLVPDMFWNDADPERGRDSIHEILDDEWGDGILSIGDTRVIQQAVRLANVTVRVIADPDDEDSFDYEEVPSTTQPPGGGEA